jgi:hypothetical protein
MKTKLHHRIGLWRNLSVLFLLFVLTAQLKAQEISVWQFRHVDQANMQNFIERETKYWSKVAETALEKGNLTFWGLFVKQGGFDVGNTPNVIFINTFKDIDAANMSAMWDPTAIFPNVPMEDMETYSMSKVLHMFYVSPGNWAEKEGANPDEEFNYVRFIFHNSQSPGQVLALENEHWAPFIKSAMDAGHTKQVAWGNAQILAPSGPNIEANTISYDVFPDLKSALTGGWSDAGAVEFPQEGLSKINELETSRRYNNVYRRIKVVNIPPAD